MITAHLPIDKPLNPVDLPLAAARILTAIPPRRIAAVLAMFVAALLVIGFAANVVIYILAPATDHWMAKFMMRFDLGHEPSLPNWYSSLALLAAAMLLALIAVLEHSARSTQTLRWAILAVGFLVLATDEAILIHEMADVPLHEWLGTTGFLYFAWVIPYSVIALVAGLFFLPFLIRMDRHIRRLMLISGVMYVSGAIGVELIEGSIVDVYGVAGGFASLQLNIAQTIEEGLEMYAVVLFIYALMLQLARYTNCPAPHQ